MGCGPGLDAPQQNFVRAGQSTTTWANDGTALPPLQTFPTSIAIDDPDAVLSSEQRSALIGLTQAAVDMWGAYIESSGQPLIIRINVADTATGRAAGRSASYHARERCHSAPACTLAEAQSTHRLRTGQDNPQQAQAPDIEISVPAGYFTRETWIDPNPYARSDRVPADKIDLLSVLMHELGHGFGISGYRDERSGSKVGNWFTFYDDLIKIGPDGWFFVGQRAMEAFGGPVPITRDTETQNLYHYGDPHQPSSIDQGLMNGLYYVAGQRYWISPVDVGILEDIGVPMRPI